MKFSDLVAEKLHKEWAKNKRMQLDAEGDRITEVWKDTGDVEYDRKMIELDKENRLPRYVKIEDGKVFIDILNMPYKELSSKWKGENEQAGEAVEDIMDIRNMNLAGLAKTIEKIDDERLEEMASLVHKRWMDRRKQELKENPNAWVDQSLMVPYEELSKYEQLKDKAQVVLAIEVAKKAEKAMALDYALDRAYGDRPRVNEDGTMAYPQNAMYATAMLSSMPKFTKDEIEIMSMMYGENSQNVLFAKQHSVEDEKSINKESVTKEELNKINS